MKKVILIILVLIFIVVIVTIVASEWYTGQPEFCGSCHIMKKYYKQWSNDKHSKEGVTCVDCHYAPGQRQTVKAKFGGLRHLFTYLSVAEKEVRKAPIVSDLSCTASECHPKQKLEEKKEMLFHIMPLISL